MIRNAFHDQEHLKTVIRESKGSSPITQTCLAVALGAKESGEAERCDTLRSFHPFPFFLLTRKYLDAIRCIPDVGIFR